MTANIKPKIFGLHVAIMSCMYPAISDQNMPRINKRKSALSAILRNSIGLPPNYFFGLTLNTKFKRQVISMYNGAVLLDVTILRRNCKEFNQDGA